MLNNFKDLKIMAIFYKMIFRNNEKHPEMTGYFAVIANKGMVTTDEIADEIQRNCSMKRSDVLAVLAELSEVIRNNVQQSHSVKLNGIGVFRPGISSSIVKSLAQFTPQTNIRALRLNFLPETMTIEGKRIKKVFENARLIQEERLSIKQSPDGMKTEAEGKKADAEGMSADAEGVTAAGDSGNPDGETASVEGAAPDAAAAEPAVPEEKTE